MIHDPTAAPALAVGYPEPIGRLYKFPGAPTPPTNIPKKEVRALLANRTLVPSITNVIGVLNKPYLNPWYGKRALEELFAAEEKWAGRILSKPQHATAYFKDAGTRTRDESAAHGSVVHYACELINRNKPIPNDLYVSSDQEEAVNCYRDFCDTMQPEILAVEQTVYGKNNNGKPYAGTTDIIMKINGTVLAVDIKTNKKNLHSEIAYQLAAVRNATFMAVHDTTIKSMIPIQATYGLHLSSHAYTFAPIQTSQEVWQGFSDMRDLWETYAFNGSLANNTPFIGRRQTDPSQITPDDTNLAQL